jgi:hypothetical protein
MFQLSCKLPLVVALLAHSGCAYTFKETGHRDLDRSIHAADECCACAATGAMVAACSAAVVGLIFWDTDSDDPNDDGFEDLPPFQTIEDYPTFEAEPGK